MDARFTISDNGAVVRMGKGGPDPEKLMKSRPHVTPEGLPGVLVSRCDCGCGTCAVFYKSEPERVETILGTGTIQTRALRKIENFEDLYLCAQDVAEVTETELPGAGVFLVLAQAIYGLIADNPPADD